MMKRRWVLGSAAVLVALAIIVPTVVLAQGGSEQEDSREGPPWARSPGPPPELPLALRTQRPPNPVTREELAKADEILHSGVTDRVTLSDGSGLVSVAGPGTRGKTITVGGVSVKLPDDAELNGIIGMVSYEYDAKRQPGFRPFPTPAYSILRGEARMVVSLQTGEFIVTGGKPEDHQFLIDALGEGKRFPSTSQ